jgi:pSer/pThr/pTyr-binding forkhead associated (FHA) protein
VVFDPDTDRMLPMTDPSAGAAAGFPEAAFDREVVSIDELRRTGLPLEEVTYLAVGGGLGSFVWVDHLAIFGARPEQIAAVGPYSKPYGRYQVLTRNSQIPLRERIRSHSESAPDNIWGFPGYAAREGWRALRQGNLARALQLAWQTLGENATTQTYTPLIGDVFASLDREAARIGWDRIWRYGAVRAIRKTDDGRFVAAFSRTAPQSGRSYGLLVAPYLHIAVGYPGIKLLPDLQEYRERTGDFRTVVNAYEDHEHVYEHLRRQGGVVLMRGRGIVASRILQRISEVRRENASIAVLHLMRTPIHEGQRFGASRRAVEHHWEFQQFNWPKATWGGEYKEMLERADESRRKQLLQDWGGTTTARRQDWLRIVDGGIREGWYGIRFGTVKDVQRAPSGKLVTRITAQKPIEEETQLEADYVIDCTGLESAIEDNPLLKDLVARYDLPRNPMGRLHVANDFELPGLRNDGGRAYASGIMTLGGPLAGVDTFLGLQWAALQSVDALVNARAPGLRRLNGLGSLVQWIRWARGMKP